MSNLDENGREVLDNEPVSIPVRIKRMQTEASRLQTFVIQEMSRIAEQNGFETFEEADDFDDNDEFDVPLTKHELAGLEANDPLVRQFVQAARQGFPNPGVSDPPANPAEPAKTVSEAGGSGSSPKSGA